MPTRPLNKHLARSLRILAIAAASTSAVLLYRGVELDARVLMFPAPTAIELKLALARGGLDAQALTAAGVSTNHASGVVADVRDYLIANPGVLSVADSAFVTAQQQVETLQRKIQSGQATEQEAESFASAQSTLASATSSRQGAIDAVFNAGTADMNETQELVLNRIRANKSGGWDLPIEFLTVQRSEPQWVALRSALANERVAVEREIELDSESATLLSVARGDATVAAAIAGLAANSAAINTAWNTAVDQ